METQETETARSLPESAGIFPPPAGTDAEREKARKLAEKLRELGIDPDSL